MATIEIGCCGAYCKTCRAHRDGSCAGCRMGYESGERDITRAKCKIKVCCMTEKRVEMCAVCDEFLGCEIVQTWYDSAGGARRKYRRSAEFICEHGAEEFVKTADGWRDASGKIE